MGLKSAIIQELDLVRSKASEWRTPVGFLIVAGAVVILAVWSAPRVHRYLLEADALVNLALAGAYVFAAAAIFLIAFFFVAFKGINADEVRLNRAVTYCYAFVIFSLFGSMLPFFFLPRVPNFEKFMEASPIGVVKGCSAEASGAKDDSVPIELRCDSLTDQWVVNLGGAVSKRPPKPRLVSPAAAEGTPAGTAANAMPAGAAAPTGSGDVTEIQGGLVIPLYVVVLSIMGATVSMTRRVPEYQRRLSPKDPHFMSYDEAREALVFQVMQVCSAPLIAVTMYYLIDPGSRATTIVLAFASGFSSETILLLIRAFLEKIKPGPAAAAPAAANIVISPARLDFGKVELGTSAVNTVAIVNPTAVDLEVMSLKCTGSGEFAVPDNYSAKVGAGKSVSIDVTFTPKSAGRKNAVLTVTDNAPGSPRAIDMFGEGGDPASPGSALPHTAGSGGGPDKGSGQAAG